MTDPETGENLSPLQLHALKPYFSITVLECASDDWGRDFQALVKFLGREAAKPGQAVRVKITAEIQIGGDDGEQIDGAELLFDSGFDRLSIVTRSRTHVPGWATKDSGIFDVVNELSLALRRQRLIAIRTDMVSPQSLLRWVSRPTTPLQALSPEVLMSTFIGDGSGLWLQGVHRQRSTKADNKALYGIRLQEALDAIEDASYAMSAMQVRVIPIDESARIRGTVTVSPDKSSIAFKAMPNLHEFLAVADEALGMIEKTFAAETPPDSPFPGLAVREKNLSRVYGAYDVRVASPEEIAGNPHFDDRAIELADLLRESLLDVVGDPKSPAAFIDVGSGGSKSGTLKVQPIPSKGSGFELDVRFSGTLSDERTARAIRDAVRDTDLLSIFYETGHTYAERRICSQQLATQAFKNIEFRDFSGYDVSREKPKVFGDQAIHESIGVNKDNSLFAWVLKNFSSGWLLCDDGAGEIADFLHLDYSGTLSVIHVKAAHSGSSTRRIAVTAFEELVSQAEKNVHRIRSGSLAGELQNRSIQRPACWSNGQRVDNRTDFIEQLEMRVARDRTQVILVQPHLLQGVYDAAREATTKGQPTTNSRSAILLDTLLHSTRRTITSLWDDMLVIGCI